MSRNAVVTGSTRGIGRGLAEALVARGYRVAIASPTASDAREAAAEIGNGAVGFDCDVRDAAQVQALFDGAVAAFGSVDLWVNNAGLALTGAELADLPSADFRQMLEINVLGTMHGCQVALTGMRARGHGAIYNVFGAGSDGQPVPHMIGYATTKRAVQFLTESLAAEMRGGPVLLGAISPGLVISEGFLREHGRTPAGPEREARERWVNVIGDHVETVAGWAADIFDTNNDHGAVFAWLSPDKIAARQRDEPDRDVLSRYAGQIPG
jgi:NAD(P)-dependent dehydrogenase (short-subunit alcohol dehydrogenase family)